MPLTRACTSSPPLLPAPCADQIGDLGVGAAERDDDDDYNPEEDSSDSEGGRRGRKARLARQMQLAQGGGMGLGPFGEPDAPPVFEQRRGRGRPPGRGRGRSSGLTWSATSGRGGRGSSAAGAGPLAPPCGAPWTRQQVQEQQRVHLGTVQKGIAEALATNNAQMLAHWTSGAGGPQLPAPLSLVRGLHRRCGSFCLLSQTAAVAEGLRRCLGCDIAPQHHVSGGASCHPWCCFLSCLPACLSAGCAV